MILDFLLLIMLCLLVFWRFGDVFIEWKINKGIDKGLK